MQQQSSTISDYLDELSRELSFDLPLALRVRQEVADHLWETVTANPEDGADAQQQAIEKFGAPAEIAQQYMASSLLKQTKRTSLFVFLAIMGIFVAMQARVMLYAPVSLQLGDNVRLARGIAFSIDRWATLLALAVGTIGLIYVASRRAPMGLHSRYRVQIRRYVLFCASATFAITLSVLCDAVLTGTRLLATGLAVSALFPIFSMAFEIVLVGLVIASILHALRRASNVASLPHA